MSRKSQSMNTANLVALIQNLQTQLQSMEEKIKSQNEEIKRLRKENQKKIKAKHDDSNTNDSEILFGSINEDWDNDKLKDFCNNGDSNGLKKYICSYYARIQGANFVLFYKHQDKKYNFISNKDFRNDILSPIDFNFFQRHNTKLYLINWFFYDTPIYDLDSDPNKPMVFKEGNHYYINMIHGRLHYHKERKALNSYPKDIIRGVKKVWTHIKEAWCSGKKDQFEYVQKWISHVVSGRRMQTCIYLYSVQGIGKSIIIKFLTEQVLGRELVYSTSKVNIFTEKFNTPLVGRLLFVLEEAPALEKEKWSAFENSFKNYLTENLISVEEKYQKPFMIKNTVSFIINTNKRAIRISYDDRRFFQPDTSDKYKKNADYFNELGKIIENPDVGEAFYMNCLEIAENSKDFREEFDRPRSDIYDENIADNVPSAFRFIKEAFIMKKKGINMKFKDLYDKYTRFCELRKINHPLHKLAFRDELINIKIKYVKNSTKHLHFNWVENTYDELVHIFLKNRLMKEEELGDVEEEKQIPTVGEVEQKIIEDYIENKEEEEVIEEFNQNQEELDKGQKEMKRTDLVDAHSKHYCNAIVSCPSSIQKYTKKKKNKQSKTEETESEASVKVDNKMKII